MQWGLTPCRPADKTLVMKIRHAVWTALLLAALPAPARADQDTLDASLRHACRQGLLGDVQKLLAEGARVEAPASYGETALHYAALYGHTKIVRELIRSGASIDQTDNNDNTALLLASLNCNNRTVAALIQAGADPNIENHHGSTALTLATEQGCGKTVQILLKAPGIRVAHRDDWDKSAIDYAVQGGLEAGFYDPATMLRLRKAARAEAHPPRP
jgi:ankyrin repeat protein